MIRRALVCVLFAALSGCDYFSSTADLLKDANSLAARGEYRAAAIQLHSIAKRDAKDAAVHLEVARLSWLVGEYDLADRECRAVLSVDARNEPAGELLARALLARGDSAELIKQLDAHALPLSPENAILMRAKALFAERKLDEAEQQLSRLDSGSTESVDLAVARANVLAARGHLTEALTALDRGLRSGSAVDALLLRASILANRGLFAQAGEAYSKSLEPTSGPIPFHVRATALLGLTEVALSQGNATAAAESLQQLQQLVGDNVATLYLSARVNLIKGQYAEGVATLQRLVLEAPSFVPARLLLGAGQLSQGNLHQAEQELLEVIQRAPDNLEARKLLARAQLQMHRPEEAVKSLTGPAEVEQETDPEIASLMGASQLQSGDRAGAVATLERAAAGARADTGVQLDLAAAYLAAGRGDNALAVIAKVPEDKGGVRRTVLWLRAIRAVRGPGALQAEVETLVRTKPGDLDVAMLAASYYAGERDFNRARALLRAAVDAHKGLPAPLMALVHLELSVPDNAAAERWARQAAALEPSNVQYSMVVADIQARRGDQAGAAATLLAARRAAPDAAEPKLALAEIEFRRGNPTAAEKELRDLVDQSPQDPKVLNSVGRVLVSAQRYDEALARFRAAAELDSGNADYWMNIGRAQLAMDQSGAARESLERARAIVPDSIVPVSALALIDLRERRTESALERVNQLKARQRGNPAVHVLEGDVRMATGAYREAAAAYTEAEGIAPSAAVAIKLYGARRLAKLDDADASLRQWLVMHPDDVSVREALAAAKFESGETEAARREYELLVQQGTRSPAAYNNLALLYQEARDPRARKMAERARELAPANPAVADTLGWILFQGGDVAGALTLLEAAAKAMPKDADTQFHLAAALAQAQRADEARARLRTLLEGSAGFSSRREAEALLKKLQGEGAA